MRYFLALSAESLTIYTLLMSVELSKFMVMALWAFPIAGTLAWKVSTPSSGKYFWSVMEMSLLVTDVTF